MHAGEWSTGRLFSRSYRRNWPWPILCFDCHMPVILSMTNTLIWIDWISTRLLDVVYTERTMGWTTCRLMYLNEEQSAISIGLIKGMYRPSVSRSNHPRTWSDSSCPVPWRERSVWFLSHPLLKHLKIIRWSQFGILIFVLLFFQRAESKVYRRKTKRATFEE